MSESDRRAKLLRSIEFRRMFDERADAFEREAPFDSICDLDTAAPVELWDLPEPEQLKVGRNARYAPTPLRTLRNALNRCNVRHRDTTFVDVGSGKGRVLLLATEFPFRRIVGVEASETLCDIARRNVKAAAEVFDACERIEVVHADATEFDIPDDAGLFYFYEPFSAEVSAAVLDRIEESIHRNHRSVVLCFTGRGQPDEEGSDGSPVAAFPAEARAQWNLIEIVRSPDAEFYDSFLYEYVDCPGCCGRSSDS